MCQSPENVVASNNRDRMDAKGWVRAGTRTRKFSPFTWETELLESRPGCSIKLLFFLSK